MSERHPPRLGVRVQALKSGKVNHVESPEPRSGSFDGVLASLQESLAYRFQDTSLLNLALSVLRPPLTPEAAAARQRLEFLGDAAWDFAVAEAVFRTWPHATAGDLTRFRSTWCSTPGLAEIARQVALPVPHGPGLLEPSDRLPAELPADRSRGEGKEDRLGPNDRLLAELPAARSRGKKKGERSGPSDRVLAELLEAVLGAMVEDGGLDAVRALAERMITQHGMATTPPPVDPKSALQMLVQARYCTLPAYHLLQRRGPPHQPTFRVVVRVNGEGIEVLAEAEGNTRQAAEQEAARLAIQRLTEGSSP